MGMLLEMRRVQLFFFLNMPGFWNFFAFPLPNWYIMLNIMLYYDKHYVILC